MAHSHKRNDKFTSTNLTARDFEADIRRTQPYRRTKFRVDPSSSDD